MTCLASANLAAAAVVVERVVVEVAPLDPLGRPWDSGQAHAAPDPQIDIVLDGAKLKRCKKALDSFVGDCEVPDHAPLTSATEIELRVNDADHGLDERIGTARGVIHPDASGRIELEVQGKVVGAWVEVRHTADPLMSPALAWTSGIVVGAALALMIAVLLGRRTTAAHGEPPRRSPLQLAARGAALVALAAAWFVHSRVREPLVSAIPLALGSFCVTAALVEIRKRLDQARVRTLLVGCAGMASVFALRWLDGAPDLLQKGFLVVAVVVLILLFAG